MVTDASRLPLLSGAAIAVLLLTLAPVSLAADAPAMSPTTGPPTGGTVVEITGGSGYTDSTTVTMCGVTVAGHRRWRARRAADVHGRFGLGTGRTRRASS
jgi:hypothetical protein